MDEEQKHRLLKKEAACLEGLLIRYGRHDEKVREVLKYMTPLFQKIGKGLVHPPHREDFGPYFCRDVDDGFGGIQRRYPDIFNQYVRYASVLEDAISDPLYRQRLVEADEQIWWEQKQ